MPLSVRADIALSMTWVKHHCTGKPNPLSTVVAVATDAPNLLPIIAVINSTFSNAAEPDLVSMVVITRHVNRLILALKEFLPQYLKPTVICGGFSDLLMQRPALRKLQSLHNSTRVKRKELLSPFNFAAFYLPYVLRESKRVLYLDSDTVVRTRRFSCFVREREKKLRHLSIYISREDFPHSLSDDDVWETLELSRDLSQRPLTSLAPALSLHNSTRE